MKKIVLIVLVLMLSVSVVYAISEDYAYRAAGYFKYKMPFRVYFGTGWTENRATSCIVVKDGGNSELKINSTVYDPARLYIKVSGNWVNLASLCGEDRGDNPEFLTESKRNP